MTKITLRRVERRLVEAGFTQVYPEAAADVPDLVPRDAPPIRAKVGDRLRVKRVSKQQRFAQPPPRWSEAALIKQLEKRGIGRPSTYADIVDTLIERNYARREGQDLWPQIWAGRCAAFWSSNLETCSTWGSRRKWKATWTRSRPGGWGGRRRWPGFWSLLSTALQWCDGE